MSEILVVDDDPRVLASLEYLLSNAGHIVRTERSGEGALASVLGKEPDLVVMDVWLPGMDGIETFRGIKERCPHVPLILMTGTSTTELAIEASKLGVFDYRVKPLDPVDLLELIRNALSSARLMREPVSSEVHLTTGSTIVGDGPGMQQVYRMIGRVAPTNATVLIRGDSGTGKGLVARAIHEHSPRSSGPFVIVNCVAIPEALLESELFGYERGAFTGAGGRRVGRFEHAEGGTIVLDEIGDVPLAVQAKILRVLQERCFERLGGNETLRTNARVIASTNRNLEAEISAGRFREDLYYRLNVVSVQIPPLQDRREDIPRLIEHFLQRFGLELEMPVPKFSAEAHALLLAYDWPGNVRELEHCLKRAMILSAGFPIRAEDLKRALDVNPQKRQAGGGTPSPTDLQELIRQYLRTHAGPEAHAHLMDEVEHLMLLEALHLAKGKQTRAAQLLGIPRPTLHLKIRKHRIQIEGRAQRISRQESEQTSEH